MRKDIERISRGRQIVRLWETLNYEEPESLRETLVDMLADLYHLCIHKQVSWTDVVSNAEKWGLVEGLAETTVTPETPEDRMYRLLKEISEMDDEP